MTLIRPRNYRPPGTPKPAGEPAAAKPAPAGASEPAATPAPAEAHPRAEPRVHADAETRLDNTSGKPADLPTAPAPPAPPAPPAMEMFEVCLRQALGSRFEVLRPIAIGGMAVLFQLRHRTTGGLFVAKMMRPEWASDPGLREAFAREARIGAKLAGHPNAVAILDLDDTLLTPKSATFDAPQAAQTGPAAPDQVQAARTPYLLMPYIDGEDMDQVLAQRGRLDRDEALMLLAQLGSLLMYAETEGVVHADIGLGNIRLDRFGQYRLLDYGLARGTGDALEDLHAASGTPAYNSPEQLHGQALDTRSDLYSLGLVFFHALTGRPAFQTTDLDRLARAHLEGAWELPADLVDDLPLATLLRSLLAVNRDARMSSAFELSGAMAALGYELPSFFRSLAITSLTAPRMRRRRLQRVSPDQTRPDLT